MLLIKRALPALSLLLLAGCGMGDGGPFGSRKAVAPNDSLTAQRVMGTDPAFEPLKPESGNVWPSPEEETQRTTLGNAGMADPVVTRPVSPSTGIVAPVR